LSDGKLGRLYEEAATLEAMRGREKDAPGAKLSWFFVVYKHGSEYLGSAVVEAYGPADAALRLSEAAVDPGRGNMTMMPLAPEQLPPEDRRCKLLTEAEVKELWPGGEAKEGA